MAVSRGGKGAIGGSNWTYFGTLPRCSLVGILLPRFAGPYFTLQGKANKQGWEESRRCEPFLTTKLSSSYTSLPTS
jgi:hypothetical protein